MRKLMSFNLNPTEETLNLVCRAKNCLDVSTKEICAKNYVKTSPFFLQSLYFTPYVEGLDIIGILTDDEPIFLLSYEYLEKSNHCLQGLHQLHHNTELKAAFNRMLENLDQKEMYRAKAVYFKLSFYGFIDDQLQGVRSCASYRSTLERVELLDFLRTKPYAAQTVKLQLTPLLLITKNSVNMLATKSFKRLYFDRLKEMYFSGIKKVFVATGLKLYVFDVDLFFKINPLTVFLGAVSKRPNGRFLGAEICTSSLTTIACILQPLPDEEECLFAKERFHSGAHVTLLRDDEGIKINWKTLGTGRALTYFNSLEEVKLINLFTKGLGL